LRRKKGKHQFMLRRMGVICNTVCSEMKEFLDKSAKSMDLRGYLYSASHAACMDLSCAGEGFVNVPFPPVFFF
jgi:hypothetical protein